jgi:hypothetical protein
LHHVDLGGDFGGISAYFINLRRLTHIHEVFVEALNFDRGAGLVNGGLRDGGEQPD